MNTYKSQKSINIYTTIYYIWDSGISEQACFYNSKHHISNLWKYSVYYTRFPLPDILCSIFPCYEKTFWGGKYLVIISACMAFNKMQHVLYAFFFMFSEIYVFLQKEKKQKQSRLRDVI